MPKCSVPNCESQARSRGFCVKHYQRFQKYGTPDGGVKNHAAPEERFWRFVTKGSPTRCWLWQGAKSSYGYGQIKVSENPVRYKLAHRLSYGIHKGPLTPDDIVRHSCDNPLCVNPRHLTAGTHSENNADMVAKGRNRAAPHIGSQNPNVILTADEVRRIRSSPLSHAKVAEKFGVSKSTIAAIRARRIWDHIP